MFRIIAWIERLCERIYYGPIEDADVIKGLEYLAQPNYDDLIEGIVPGHRNRMARLDERYEAEDRQRHEKEVRALKKARFEQELEDAQWILDYEKRLERLQAKTTTRRSKAAQAGINADRLRRLEHLD